MPISDTHRLGTFTLGGERYTPVVVLTRCLEIKSYLDAVQLRAADYFEKSLSEADLQRLVATRCKPRQGEFSPAES